MSIIPLRSIKTAFRRYEQNFLLISVALSILLCGFLGGMVLQKYVLWIEAPGFAQSDIVSPQTPLVFLEKIENGVLFGRNEGSSLRFIVGSSAEIFPQQNGTFSFSVTEILPLLKQIPAPAGMHFVASERGSKFYPLDAPEAALLSPKNRIFFATAAAAKAQGYAPGK